MKLTRNSQRGTEVWQMWRTSYGTMRLIKVLHSYASACMEPAKRAQICRVLHLSLIKRALKLKLLSAFIPTGSCSRPHKL